MDLQSSRVLTVLLVSHACPGCAPLKHKTVDLDVTGILGPAGLGSGGGGAVVIGSRANLTRINSTSANPKAVYEGFGHPDYPTPRQIAAMHAAAIPAVHSVKVTVTKAQGKPPGGFKISGIELEPYSVVAVTVALHSTAGGRDL